MKLKEFFNFIIQKGIEVDPRSKTEIQRILQDENKKFKEVPAKEKAYFDNNRLANPYSDTRILFGDENTQIKTIAVGIDVEGQELLLIDKLREKGKRVDLALAHHPEGRAFATFYQVMRLQPELVSKFGVPINIGEGLMEPRMKEVWRRVMAQNHNRHVDIAKLLNIPYMSCHTPADNHVSDFLQKLFDKRKPQKLGDIIDILLDIPEYNSAAKLTQGPEIIVGSKEKKPGKIFVDMTGGTEGPSKYVEKLSHSGVGTLIGMHYSDDHIKEAEKNNINVVIAGHISSDVLGINLLLDKVQKKFGDLQFLECSGFRRFRRKSS
ncbi:MAG: NGG1p interacting factor NIF3 [bacterium]